METQGESVEREEKEETISPPLLSSLFPSFSSNVGAPGNVNEAF